MQVIAQDLFDICWIVFHADTIAHACLAVACEILRRIVLLVLLIYDTWHQCDETKLPILNV